MTNPTGHDTMGGDHQDTSTRDMAPLALADLATLPAVLDLMTAARALAIGRTKAYSLARQGKFPCRIIHVGGTYRVPTADLHRLLGTDQTRQLGTA